MRGQPFVLCVYDLSYFGLTTSTIGATAAAHGDGRGVLQLVAL